MTRLLLIAALALGVLVVAGCDHDELSRAERSGSGGGPTDVLRVDKSGWRTDFSKHNVPLSEFQSGGPPRDGIPPIDKPKPTSQADADEWLADREPVLSVEVGDRVRAYPLQILVWHEIVNDRLGGRPIAITYCPLCNSSIARRAEHRGLARRRHGRRLRPAGGRSCAQVRAARRRLRRPRNQVALEHRGTGRLR